MPHPSSGRAPSSTRLPAGILVAFACCAGAALALPARADVMPPETARAHERMQDPDKVDRTDQFCRSRDPGEACTIPGTAFEGGGPGKCERLVSSENTIDLQCMLDPAPLVDRQFPNPDFDSEAGCASLLEMPEDQRPACVVQVGIAADRFCAGREAGAACTAEVALGDAREQHEGQCKLIVQTRSYYAWGRHHASRDVLSCEPLTPAPKREYRETGFWRWLFGWI